MASTTQFPLAPYSSYLFYLIALVPGLLTVFILWIAYAVNNVSMAVRDDKLELSGMFYGRTLDKSQLKVDEARVVDLSDAANKDLRPARRSNGVGLPSLKLGWFYLGNGQRALVFLSSQRAVYLPTTEGYPLLVSPKEPETFVNALKR